MGLLEDESAGASASDLSLLGRLVGREDEPAVSEEEVSSRRSEGNLDEVDILDGFTGWGWSSLESQDLLPSKKGVMKDPLTMAVVREGERQDPVTVQDNRKAGVDARDARRAAADAGNLHKVRPCSDWLSSPFAPHGELGSALTTMTTMHLLCAEYLSHAWEHYGASPAARIPKLYAWARQQRFLTAVRLLVLSSLGRNRRCKVCKEGLCDAGPLENWRTCVRQPVRNALARLHFELECAESAGGENSTAHDASKMQGYQGLTP